jgi:hypothetical protein
MKAIILAVGALCFYLTAWSQNFKVVHVNGVILKGGSPLKLGDEVEANSTSSLEFQDPSAVASLFNPEKGKFKFSKAGLEPVAANVSSGATRPALCQSISAFGVSAEGKPYKYLILGSLSQKVSSTDLPLNNPDKQYFSVAYLHKGQMQERRLESDAGNIVILNKESILGSIPPEEVSEYKIIYHDNGTQKVANFTPVFPDENELKAEVEMFINLYQDNPEVMLEKIIQHLKDFYGSPNLENVKDWLADMYGIEF